MEEWSRDVRKLDRKSHKIYTSSLGHLFTHHILRSNYPRFHADPSNQREPFGVRHLLEGYTHEQSCRFVAMTRVWSRRPWFHSNNKSKGHYALYRVIWTEEGLWAECCHQNVYFTGFVEDSVLERVQVHPGYSNPPIMNGDVIMVKKMAKIENLWIVTEFELVKRRISGYEKMFIMVSNRRAVTLETGQIMETTVDLELDKVYRGDIFQPVVWNRQMCWRRGEQVNGINMKPIPMLSILHKCKPTNKFTRLLDAYISNDYTYDEQLIDFISVLTHSTLQTTLRNGRYDGRSHTVAGPLVLIRMKQVEFKISKEFSKIENWPRGTRCVVHGVNVEIQGAKIKDEDIEIRAKLVDGPNYGPSPCIYQLNYRPIQCLKLGFFKNIPNDSNGKNIIKLLFHGPGLTKTKKFEKLEILPDLGFKPNKDQWEYIYSILEQAPLTVGSFPIKSGKTKTIGFAAVMELKVNPSNPHIIICRDDESTKKMANFLEQELNFTNFIRFSPSKLKFEERHSRDYSTLLNDFQQKLIQIDRDGLYDDDLIIQAALHLSHRKRLNERIMSYRTRRLINQRKDIQYHKNYDWRFYYFRNNPPDILILKMDQISDYHEYFSKISTIHFDDAPLKMDLVWMCSLYPDAKFGILGDEWAESMSNWKMKGLMQDFGGIIKSNMVYCDEQYGQLLRTICNEQFKCQGGSLDLPIQIVDCKGEDEIQKRIMDDHETLLIPMFQENNIFSLFQEKFEYLKVANLGEALEEGIDRTTVILSFETENSKIKINDEELEMLKQLIYTTLANRNREIWILGEVEKMKRVDVLKQIIELN